MPQRIDVFAIMEEIINHPIAPRGVHFGVCYLGDAALNFCEKPCTYSPGDIYVRKGAVVDQSYRRRTLGLVYHYQGQDLRYVDLGRYMGQAFSNRAKQCGLHANFGGILVSVFDRYMPVPCTTSGSTALCPSNLTLHCQFGQPRNQFSNQLRNYTTSTMGKISVVHEQSMYYIFSST